jgi:hypothetical protein
MKIRLAARLVLALIFLSPAFVFAQTDVLTNGSFESVLTGWTTATSLETGATGTCSYNGAVAPGTETITGLAGFPATAGTQIALGSVESTSGVSARISCVLYRDVAIPAGATTATFTFDIGLKGGADGGLSTGARVGVYSTATVPDLLSSTIVGSAVTYVSTGDSTLQSRSSTVNFDVSAVAGTTVRFAIINAAFINGNEVIGIDNVKFLVNATPTPTSTSIPTLSEWAMIMLAALLVLFGVAGIRRHMT